MVILKLGNLAEGVKYKAYRTHFNLKNELVYPQIVI